MKTSHRPIAASLLTCLASLALALALLPIAPAAAPFLYDTPWLDGDASDLHVGHDRA